MKIGNILPEDVIQFIKFILPYWRDMFEITYTDRKYTLYVSNTLNELVKIKDGITEIKYQDDKLTIIS